MYGDGLRAAAHRGACQHARLMDGTAVALPLSRYLGPADATDEELLKDLSGPVLDVGCGPGRHLRALAARGVFALGVDLSPVAVEFAVGGGAQAIVGDVFDELPGCGTWRSALLLDGNIGIGGSPVRLLARIEALLHPDGELLVELEPPGTSTCSTHVRLESDGVASGWFPWARVSAPAISSIARAGGFRTTEVWHLSGRWFARLHRDHDQRIARTAARTGARAGGPPASERYREPVPALEARGITKTVGRGRGQRRVLDGVDLDVDADEVVAVLGRSGSGKSTLLHLLGGLDQPDRGEIMLAGKSLTAQGARVLARTRLH
jgi:ABC-type multidrug transport system fused ATPase/permease subunit